MSADQTTAGHPADAQSLPWTPVQVRMFHNDAFRDACLFGYRTDHSVTEVFAYTTARSASLTDNDLFGRVFWLLNVGDDPSMGVPDARAVDYRRCGNRSLSVGDLVALNGRYYACAPTGWDELENAPLIDHRWGFGTAPLYSTCAVSSERRTPCTLDSVLRAVIARWRRSTGLGPLFPHRRPPRESGADL